MEAVCEFIFTTDTSWDMTIPGLMYEKFLDRYPLKEERIYQEVQIIQQQGKQQLNQEVRNNPRILFLSPDRLRYIQMGQNMLSIHCLKPYPTWEEFRPSILMVYESLIKFLNNPGIQRIGLRYLNRIQINEKHSLLSEYFYFRPEHGNNLPKTFSGFITGCVFPQMNNRDACRIQMTDAMPDNVETMSAIILDLDYFLFQPSSIAYTQALSWVEEAHGNIETMFEGCITDKSRELFGEEK
jgi:uncharacterized protein (TIGR04255 family)